MARRLQWGTPEAEKLAGDHTTKLLRAGILAVYTTFYQGIESDTPPERYSYRNALLGELPILGYVADKDNAPGLVTQPSELHIAKVDPESGVRLDKTHLAVANLRALDEPPTWTLGTEPRSMFSDEQAELVLELAIDLAGHGLIVR
jgi:hypothetical protein